MSDFLDRISSALAGRYRIERELGAGGMATVHLAHDLRHDRRVALKVLRPELAAVIGAGRFLQEIKTTANLQHPHILGLIDSGETDGHPWYVMPFVEGESLRDRLNREKQLPVAEAVRLAIEVAGALDYAHRHGVIHRDIKPENVLLHDGRALVADFGIALAATAAGGPRLTGTGMSLGTPAYMSPEQAMGEQAITPRSDVYALGCVLYEMLIGSPPFGGPTAQAIVAEMLTGEPASLSAQRRTIPRHVEAAVLQALHKLPADRFATAAEFAAALQATSRISPVAGPGVPRPQTRAAQLLPWVLTVAAAAWLAAERVDSEPAAAPPLVYRFRVALPENAAWVSDIFSRPDLSPDGSVLVYNGRDSSGQRQLYLRQMDQLDPVKVAGSENGTRPFFSPDGRWVGFFLGTRIVRAPVAGGPPEAVCDTGGLPRATWLESNVIVFYDRSDLKQCTMSGEITPLVPGDTGELVNHPHALPADRGVLFSVQRGAVSRLAVLDWRTRAVTQLGIIGSDPRYVTTGHLVYVGRDGRLRAVPFDVSRLSVTGEPQTIGEPVPVDIGEARMALSRTGTMVTLGDASQRALVLLDRSGRPARLFARVGDFGDPRLSPDARRVALRLDRDIWLLDREQGTLTRLSFDSSASRPVWSADGRRIAYVRQIGNRNDARIINADGSAPAESLLAADLGIWEVHFPRGGRQLLARTAGGPGGRDIWLASPDSPGGLLPLLTSPANEVSPAVSPDGGWLAYVSDESGRAEVYVRSFPGIGARYQVSLDGGSEPVWSPSSGELFYRSGPAFLSAQVRAGTSFEVVRRTLLFSDGSYASDLTHPTYDVTPDGQQFVMVRVLEAASHITVTLNRFAMLGRERPTVR